MDPNKVNTSQVKIQRKRITARDLQVVQAIYERRVLSSSQIGQLFFANTYQRGAPAPSRCNKRLRFLQKVGLIERHEQERKLSEGRAPYLYYLAPKGKDFLEEEFGISINWKPQDNSLTGASYLKHLLATNDVWIVFKKACERSEKVSLIESFPDQKLARPFDRLVPEINIVGPKGGEYKGKIYDDGLLKLQIDWDRAPYARFFLEIDLKSETLESSKWKRRDWRKKVVAYNEFIRSGACKALYGSSAFRVFSVTNSDTRLQNMKRVTENAGGGNRYWFSTLERLHPDTLFSHPTCDVAGRDTCESLIFR